jgi:flavin-dependent dehydrogenase
MSTARSWHEEDHDVVVIGGGPAGSTAATYLAMRGHKVLLLERESGPRHRVGESLLPSMMPILDDFGLIEEVEALGFQRKTGGTFIWGKSREPWDVLFSNNPFLPYPYAYHVDREVFDALLLDHAQRRGVVVCQGVTVTAPIMDGERVVGVRCTDKKAGGQEREVRGRFVVDASGPVAVLGKELTHRIYDETMRQVAFYAYYESVEGPKGYRKGHVFIESNPWGWFWYIPMDGKKLGEASVGLVSGQEFKDEYREMGMEAFYERALSECTMMKELMGPNAKRITKMSAITDWAYTCEKTAGPGWFLAGDAAAFLDPLLSSGATMAMLAGYSASVCIHTAITEPEKEAGAAEFYRGNYRRMYEVTRDFIHYFYAGNLNAHSEDMFWKARSVLKLSENVGACQAFCFLVNTLPGNPHPALKKQIHMYEQFMDQIEHPLEDMKEDADLQDRIQTIEARTGKEGVGSTLQDESVLVLNGERTESWEVDGEAHVLVPVHGISFDEERPIFSSTSSWLLGKNIYPLDEAGWRLVQVVDGKRSWKEILQDLALTQGEAVEQIRPAVRAQLERLVAERLVYIKAEGAS